MRTFKFSYNKSRSVDIKLTFFSCSALATHLYPAHLQKKNKKKKDSSKPHRRLYSVDLTWSITCTLYSIVVVSHLIEYQVKIVGLPGKDRLNAINRRESWRDQLIVGKEVLL